MRITTQLKMISIITISAFVVLTPVLVLKFFDFKNAKNDYILAQAIKENFFERTSLRDQYFLYRESRVHELWDKNKETSNQLLHLADTQIQGEEDRKTLQRLYSYIEDTAAIFHRIVSNTETLKNAIGNRDIYVELDKRLYSQLLLKANAVRDATIALESSNARRVEQTYKSLTVIIGLFAFTLALVFILTTTRLYGLIRKRLILLHDGARIIANGNLNYRLMVGGTDEFSELAQSINVVVDKLNEEISKRRAREEQLAEAQLLAKIGSWHVILGEDESHDVWVISKELRKLYGYAEDQMIDASTWYAAMPAEDQELTQHYWAAAKRGEGPTEWEHRIVVNGEIRWMHVSAKIVFDEQGKALEFSGTNQDITERKQSQAALEEFNINFSSFLDQTSDFVYFKDRQSRFKFCSQTMANITGHAHWRDMLGKHDSEVFPPDTAKIYQEEEVPIFGQGKPLLNKISPYYTADGKLGFVETNKWPLIDKAGQIIGLFGISRDITERRKLETMLEQQAHEDYLTGVNNRRYFMELSEQEVSRAARYENPLSILMLDIDFFKQVNDTHGHKVGDYVLKKLAEVCRATLRAVDIIGRIGGEEFAILLPETDQGNATEVAERLRAALASTQVPIEAGLPIHFTVSIGVTSMKSSVDNTDLLLSQADNALYEAKKTGRNKVCIFRGI